MNTTTTTTTLAEWVESRLLFRRRAHGVFPYEVSDVVTGAVVFSVEADGGPIQLQCMDFSTVLTGPNGDGETAWAVTFGPNTPRLVVLNAFTAAVHDAGVEAESARV